MTVRIRRLGDVPLPCRQTEGSAGFDLCAAEDATIAAHGFGSVGTGLAVEIPPKAEAQVRPRSGLAAKHGIGVLNSPGTIDSDYRGEIRVILFNTSDQDYRVRRGDRIAQLVFSLLADVELVETDSLSETGRGPGGFGHTG
ncbi:MAG: dUTP diphosphatase [candidate division WOR-3 bacterium]|nr:dUTP diphosphatase [candidate division WOR-3 bacterium]